MVLGTVEGLLSWRRTAPPAFAEHMQPQLQETMARCGGLDRALTVTENAFTLDPRRGSGCLAAPCVMADGRVFFVPGQTGGGTAVIKPHIWDPHTGGMHQVEVPWEAGGGDEFLGGCLLLDGRVFLMPLVVHPQRRRPTSTIRNSTGCCRPGAPCERRYNSCVLLPDGRVLLVPWSATSPLIYDPKSDTITTSAAVTPAELQTGQDFRGRRAAARRPRAAGAEQCGRGGAGLRPGDDSLAAVSRGIWQGAAAVAACCWPTAGCCCRSTLGTAKTLIFDPATDTFHVDDGRSCRRSAGGRGGALLADGTVLLLPGTYSDLLECRIWDPATDTYAAAPELVAVPPLRQGVFAAGACCRTAGWCSTPWYSRVTWWCGSRGWAWRLGGMWR